MRNTDHTSSQDETKEKAKAEEAEEEKEEEVKADIKSNNPHLTGGEKVETFAFRKFMAGTSSAKRCA